MADAACTIVRGQKLQDALQQQAVPWDPRLGACPVDLDRFLCWLMRSTCSFNKFGKVGSTPLVTNLLTLPDPDFGFNIGPFRAALGVFFPPEWSAEGAYHGIFRVKIAIDVIILAGALNANDVSDALFEALTFRIIQTGTEDPFTVALNFGEPSDARDSQLVPAAGGYFLPEGMEFVPWFANPAQQGYDFQGVAPGTIGVDSYTVQCRIRSYWKEIC